MKCIECPYYSKTETHGHGETWRECTYVFKLVNEIQNIFDSNHEERYIYAKDSTKYIKNPNDNCIFLNEF